MDSITQEQISIVCVPRKEGGTGLMKTEGMYVEEVTKLMKYVESKDNRYKSLRHTNISQT
jgi:hypothetical protein